MTPLRICELFAGIGATAQGLRDLGVPFESTVCEIDSKAYRAYCAIHGDTPNLGDITKVDRLPEADLVTWTYPCISCSVAGKREGMVEGSGTASSLAWEVIRLLRSAKAAGEPLPPVLLMENVPAILHKRNLPEFERLVSVLSGIGYESSYRVLNACDYGVPQSRKRCFMVSVLRSHGGLGSFQWPEPCPDGRVLKDVLEPPEDVPERYYLSESRLEGLTRSTAKQRSKGNGFAFRPKGADDIAFSVTTQAGSRKTDNFVCVQTATLGGKGHECIRRIYSPTGLSPTVVTASGGGHIPKVELQDRSEVRYRKLSPLECLRLQGFPDDAFRAIRGLGLSDTDLYRLAGNSIAVPCLTAIYRSLRDAGLLRWRRPRDPWASKEVIYQQPIRKIMGIFRETHSTEQNTTRSEEGNGILDIHLRAGGRACMLPGNAAHLQRTRHGPAGHARTGRGGHLRPRPQEGLGRFRPRCRAHRRGGPRRSGAGRRDPDVQGRPGHDGGPQMHRGPRRRGVPLERHRAVRRDPRHGHPRRLRREARRHRRVRAVPLPSLRRGASARGR